MAARVRGASGVRDRAGPAAERADPPAPDCLRRHREIDPLGYAEPIERMQDQAQREPQLELDDHRRLVAAHPDDVTRAAARCGERLMRP